MANGGCPAELSDPPFTCGTLDMFTNFMDYTDDNCQNMFTIGQTKRSDDLFTSGGAREEMLDFEPTEPFVNAFYFVKGSKRKCMYGDTKRSHVVGSDLYLCVQYAVNPYMDFISDVSITESSCDYGYERMAAGAGFVCFKKEAVFGRLTPTQRLKDIDLFKYEIDPNSKSGEYTIDWRGYTKIGDLNKGSAKSRALYSEVFLGGIAAIYPYHPIYED